MYLLLGSHIPPDNHWNLHILIGLSVTMILVLIIILHCYCCSGIKRKSQEQASEHHLSSVRNQDQRNTGMCSLFTKGYFHQDKRNEAGFSREEPEPWLFPSTLRTLRNFGVKIQHFHIICIH